MAKITLLNFVTYGNRGDVFNKIVHVAKIGFDGTTLCQKPMLSHNYVGGAHPKEVSEVTCPGCREKLKQMVGHD